MQKKRKRWMTGWKKRDKEKPASPIQYANEYDGENR